MRRIAAALGLGVIGLASHGAGGAAASGSVPAPRPAVVPGSASVAEPAAAPAEPVYVFNLYGAEEGRADHRPGNLVLSESSTVRGVAWRTWQGRAAAGTGLLSGTWCLPGCLTEPYTVTVTLGTVKRIGGRKYFTRFAVHGDFPRPEEPDGAMSGALPTP
ncbi:hypothetical protein GCM10010517_61840 [Streptosporangium fragile]|uniref:Lipoprotein n=1 Tax=Streptosporangium fragile TaxID=46186 RepID=A0ABP6ILN6_9ACTN